MSNSPASKIAAAPVARWEDRSATRFLETGRDRMLARSRRLVEAAYELVETKGLEGLTLRAVLQQTGLSRRAFYERFQGKDDLLLAVFEESVRLAAEHYAGQMATIEDPLERLRLIIEGIVYGAKSGAAIRLSVAMSREHLRLAESRPADLQEALKPLISLLAEQLARGMDKGVIRAGDPQVLAIFVYNLVSTTMHAVLLARGSEHTGEGHSEQIATDLWQFCRRAVES